MKNLQKVKLLIQGAKDVLITCHVNPDGDAIGSMLALGLGLQAKGKRLTGEIVRIGRLRTGMQVKA
ncbi:MAG: hypothetical protein JW847_10030 [Candidatus Omnitrophica bacterium]|nr:hypothetical protein [Candidatus Omnitrophota bacterium]